MPVAPTAVEYECYSIPQYFSGIVCVHSGHLSHNRARQIEIHSPRKSLSWMDSLKTGSAGDAAEGDAGNIPRER